MKQQHNDALLVFLLACVRLLAYAYLLYRDFLERLQLIVATF
jgi:hypothetical protein